MDIKESSARKLFYRLFDELKGKGDENEQKSKLYILLEDKYRLTRTSVIADETLKFSDDQWNELMTDINKLKQGFPVQHITNVSEFYGRKFFVNEHVLIPRPETEELVHLIISENQNSELEILDVGTGSGCIPIILDLELPKATVTSIDISREALDVAEINNRSLGTRVSLINHDILGEMAKLPQVEIIVSNPPYVPNSEKSNMQQEVLMHDPHTALFVPDEDPLLFYKRIADVGIEKLKNQKKIYFEIHEHFGKDIAQMLGEKGYINIQVVKDINNKDRIVKANL